MPASPRFAAFVFLVFAGLGSACGGAARGARETSASSAGGGAGGRAVSATAASRARVDTPLKARRGKEELDRAIAELARSAEETGFTDLALLVELSARQIERASIEDAAQAEQDLSRAEAHLGRVLFVDEHSPSASNQLALLHLARAERLGRPELERAMAVCLWATRENPTFAPLRNTIGLVELALRDVAGAIRSFETAVKLDPSYFEDAERVYDRMMAERPEYANEIRLAKQRVRDLGGGALK